MKVAILGCGTEGRRVAQLLAKVDAVSSLILADKNNETASQTANKIGEKAVARQVDVTEPESLRSFLDETDVVFNGVGPYYKYVYGVLEAAIEKRVHYVDINDDCDAVEKVFSNPNYDALAKEAGITALCCMGGTPGLMNVLAKHGTLQMEKATAIHCCWVSMYWGREAPTVTDHILHCLNGEVTQFLGGTFTKVMPFSGNETMKLLNPIGPIDSIEVSYCGHSEPITLGRFIPGLEEATLKFSCYEQDAINMLEQLAKYGFADEEPVEGLAETPAAYLAKYMASPEGMPYFNITPLYEREAYKGVDPVGVVMQVEVIGESDGQRVRVVHEVHDKGGLTIANSAAIAIEGIVRGEITARGVVAPETCIDTSAFLRRIAEVKGVTLYEKKG